MFYFFCFCILVILFFPSHSITFCVLAASASAFNDDEDSQYLQASISGVQLSLTKHLITRFLVMVFSHDDHHNCCCNCFCYVFFPAMDERLSSYALIARAAVDVAIPLLTGLFTERFARLHQVLFPYIQCKSDSSCWVDDDVLSSYLMQILKIFL